MSLNALIKLNGAEITEHGRVFARNNSFDNVDTELASGNTKRYYKEVGENFIFSWKYLPDKASRTVDGRNGRNYINSVVNSGANVLLEIKESHDDQPKFYSCLITEYSEALLRHDIQSQCKYYDVSLTMESLD